MDSPHMSLWSHPLALRGLMILVTTRAGFAGAPAATSSRPSSALESASTPRLRPGGDVGDTAVDGGDQVPGVDAPYTRLSPTSQPC